jgi:hypothetical protein
MNTIIRNLTFPLKIPSLKGALRDEDQIEEEIEEENLFLGLTLYDQENGKDDQEIGLLLAMIKRYPLDLHTKGLERAKIHLLVCQKS